MFCLGFPPQLLLADPWELWLLAPYATGAVGCCYLCCSSPLVHPMEDSVISFDKKSLTLGPQMWR